MQRGEGGLREAAIRIFMQHRVMPGKGKRGKLVEESLNRIFMQHAAWPPRPSQSRKCRFPTTSWQGSVWQAVALAAHAHVPVSACSPGACGT